MSCMLFQHEIDEAARENPKFDYVVSKMAFNRWYGSCTVISAGDGNAATPEQYEALNERIDRQFERDYGRKAFAEWAKDYEVTKKPWGKCVSIFTDTGKYAGVPMSAAQLIWEDAWITCNKMKACQDSDSGVKAG